MIKYTGIFILASSISAYGAIKAGSLRSAYRLRCELLSLLKNIENAVKYSVVPIRYTVEDFSMPILDKKDFCKAICTHQNKRELIDTNLFELSQKDRDILFEFFSGLGKSPSAELELNKCRYYADCFEKGSIESEKEITTKAMLYKKIGIIAGILCVIIFI